MRVSTMLRSSATDGITNDHVRRQYITHTQNYADWLRANYKIRELKDLPADPRPLIEAYRDHLQARGLSASTIHTYLAPVAKGHHVPMQDITKPKRTADKITKGRMPDLINPRGGTDRDKPEYARVVSLANVTGLRRAEITKVSTTIGKDICGYDCVIVRGKGGKIQHQRILSTDKPILQKLIETAKSDKIISKAEMQNKIDIHAIRREHARKCYAYYVDCIAAGEGKKIYNQLIQTYKAYNPHGADPRRIAQFSRDILRSEGVYYCRGANLSRAQQNGQSGKFDRLALMAVSVWHLAHWRLDVTVVNYMV